MRKACWAYSRAEEPPFPIMEVAIHRLGEPSDEVGVLLTKVDTGYPGHLMVSTEVYREASLNLAEFPEREFGVYRTATGLVEVKRARALVEVVRAGLVGELVVETPRYLRFNRNLLGRGFLKRFRLLLDGKQSQGCLLF